MKAILFVRSTDYRGRRQTFRKISPSSDFNCNSHLGHTIIKAWYDALKQCSFLRSLLGLLQKLQVFKSDPANAKVLCTFQRLKKIFLLRKNNRKWFCFFFLFLAEHLPSYMFGWLPFSILNGYVYWAFTKK